MVLRDPKRIGKALIVNDLALAKELEWFAHVGVVNHPEQIVIGHARLLLC